jgi:hypothetical protein
MRGNSLFKKRLIRIPHLSRAIRDYMTATLNEVTGFRGEKILELGLTDYASFSRPLFSPGFLGDKWPAIDFYVELIGVRKRTPYFFAQAKSTRGAISGKRLRISTKRQDVARLLRVPGPTYIFGIHEPTMRIFVRSVHAGIPESAITTIPIDHELTTMNLKRLYDEVKAYWTTTLYKPRASVFA